MHGNRHESRDYEIYSGQSQMTGWLIYDELAAKRNSWFIDELIKAGDRLGIKIILKIFESDNLFKEDNLPDLVIVRTINPQINLFFESHKIPSFNNYKTSYIANNKWNSHKMCQVLSIPTMQTQLLSLFSPGLFTYPFVIKSLDGHGGSEVFLIKTHEEFLRFEKIKDDYIVQEFSSTAGIDMRVYCMGEKIIAGIIRKSKNDFRSNYSLGGSVSIGEITGEQEGQIRRIYDFLEYDFVGIDFICHNGIWVLNEIEDVVGSRMLYKCLKIDVANLYIEHILRKMADFKKPYREG